MNEAKLREAELQRINLQPSTPDGVKDVTSEVVFSEKEDVEELDPLTFGRKREQDIENKVSGTL